MVDKHIVRCFDNDLEGIRNHINSISGLVETQLSYCYKSLSERDADLAERVIKRDKQIDNLYQELMDLSIRLFALRQPFANDLRYVFSSLKIASDLERIGDSTKNIAKAARWLAKLPQTQNILSIDNLFDSVNSNFRKVTNAYNNEDSAKVTKIWLQKNIIRREVIS